MRVDWGVTVWVWCLVACSAEKSPNGTEVDEADEVTMAQDAEVDGFELDVGDADSFDTSKSMPEIADPDAIEVTDGSGCADADFPPGDPLAFSTPSLVASTPGNSKAPVIAVLCGTLHVIWHDFTHEPANLRHATRVLNAPEWTSAPLEFTEDKSIFPELLAHEDHLHLVWQADGLDGTRVMHAIWREAWSEAQAVMPGRLPRLARTASNQVHVVAFDGDDVVHATGEEKLVFTSKLEISEKFVDTLDLGLGAEGDALVVGLATSPGDTSYDIRKWRSTGNTWGPMETVYASFGLSSNDLDVVTSVSGPLWFWTEQDFNVPEDIPVVMLRPGDIRPTRVTREHGFAMFPTAALPPDGKAIVAWISPRDTVVLGREPFSADIEIGGTDATYPRLSLGPNGSVQLVFSARDENGVQQIWHSSNMPR